MKICGIEIPENAKCRLFCWPLGTDLSRVAHMYIYNGDERSNLYHLTELESGLEENALMGEICDIKFIKKENGEEQENGAMAVIDSGQYTGEVIFLKIKKDN